MTIPVIADPVSDLSRQNAQSAGMKNSCLALAEDGMTFTFNPALTSIVKKNSIGASYCRLNSDFNWSSLLWIQRSGKFGFGVALNNNSLEDGFMQYNSDDNPTTSASYSSQRYCFNISTAPIKEIQIGINAIYLQENIGGVKDYSSSGIDAGFRYQPLPLFAWAVTAQDIFTKETTLRTGFSLSIIPSSSGQPRKKTLLRSEERDAPVQRSAFYSGLGNVSNGTNPPNFDNKLDTDTDSINKEGSHLKQSTPEIRNARINFEADYSIGLGSSQDQALNTGIELRFIPELCIRTGIEYDLYRQGLTFGLGCTVEIRNFHFDYAFNLASLFNNHFFGITFMY